MLPGITFGGVVRRLLRVPFAETERSSRGHGESVASVAVESADGEAGHVGEELLEPLLLSSGRVHCAERGHFSCSGGHPSAHHWAIKGPYLLRSGPDKCLLPLLRSHSSATLVSERILERTITRQWNTTLRVVLSA